MSSAGTWHNHRFGSRVTTSEIDYIILKSFLSKCEDLEQVCLLSIFGDPACYNNFESLIKYCADRNVRVLVVTYGMSELKKYKILNTLPVPADVIVKIDGIYTESGSVYSNAVWDTIHKNLESVDGKITLEFYVYNHNTDQIPMLSEICNNKNWNLRILPGTFNAQGLGVIVDCDGNWIHDVHPVDFDGLTKMKTVEGWHVLKHYVQSQSLTPVTRTQVQIEKIWDSHEVFLGVSGELYSNFEEFYHISSVNDSNQCTASVRTDSANIYLLN
jgi:hypothetical protein